MVRLSVGSLLEMAAESMGKRVALGSRVGGLTFAEVLERARRTASWIEAAKAERVGLVDVSSDAVPVLLFAGSIAGVPFAPVNYRLADEKLRSIVARLAPAVVVAAPDAVARLDGIEGLTVLTAAELSAEARRHEPKADGFTDPDEVAIMLFTSGTTGDPKAALLRHKHLVSYVLSTIEFMGADEDEAALASVPPYHIAGMATILSNFYAGRRLVYMPSFDPNEWVATVDAEGITHAMVVPTMLGRILDAVVEVGTSLPTLRHLSYGGGRMPVPTIERALDLMPHVGFVNAYGLTETSSTVAVLGPDDHLVAHFNDDPVLKARLGSVGQPLPSLEVEIRDPHGNPVPAGDSGEIYVRGEQVAGEYDGRRVLTADGWYPTHDGGHLDEDGYLYVEGRLDDVIVRGGENMSPGEIEDVLLEHPAVSEAAVTGVHNDEWGEAVAAVVVLEDGASATAADIQAWVRTHLRSSRVPSVVEFRTELPYNETGKLLRRVLKAELGNRR